MGKRLDFDGHLALEEDDGSTTLGALKLDLALAPSFVNEYRLPCATSSTIEALNVQKFLASGALAFALCPMESETSFFCEMMTRLGLTEVSDFVHSSCLLFSGMPPNID